VSKGGQLSENQRGGERRLNPERKKRGETVSEKKKATNLLVRDVPVLQEESVVSEDGSAPDLIRQRKEKGRVGGSR